MAVDAGTATGYLDLDISGFLAGLRSAQSEAQQTTNNIATQIGKGFQGVGKALTSAGSTLTKSVTTPIVGLGTAITKISADFESSMSKVKAISGASGEDFDMLTAKAREMGAKTKFSASEAADAFQYMAMAGWDVENMMGGITGVMNLAAASGEDLATVSDIVTDAMTAFGLSADGTSKVLKDGLMVEVDNTTRFVDALAAASNSSNTNVSMLGESFKYVAPVAGALGYSVEDAAIALGLMANQGIKASNSGTALRTLLTNMANPTDTMAAAMDTLGISLENSDGSMKSLMEVMQDLRKGFAGGKMDADEFSKKALELNDAFNAGEITAAEYEMSVNDLMVAMYGAEGAQKAQLAAQLAGKQGMAGLLAIVNTGEEDFNKLADSIYNAAGTSQEMADIMNDNLSGQMTILSSMLQEVALQFGEILLPVIKDVVAWLQNMVTKLQEMTPEQKEQVARWAAIAAAIGPVLLVFGKLTTSIGGLLISFGKLPGMFSKLHTGFKNIAEGVQLARAGFPAMAQQASKLGAAIGGISLPMVALVAAIGTLVAAFKHLWDTNEQFRENITAIWDGIKKKFEEFGQGIVDRLNEIGFDFQNITEVMSAVWDKFCELLAPVFEGVFSQLSNILSAALDILTGIFDVFIGIFTGDWEQAWNGVKEIFAAVWEFIKNTFENWVNAFTGIANVIFGWFGTSWDEVWENAKQTVVTFVNNVIQWFSNLPTRIKEAFDNVIAAVVQWKDNLVASAQQAGSNFIQSVSTFFSELPYKIGLFLGEALGHIIQWAIDMPNKAREMGASFIEAVVTFFTELPGRILEFITSAKDNVTQWASEMSVKAREAGSNFVNGIVNFLVTLPGKILAILTSIISNLATFVLNMGSKATEAARTFYNNIVNGVKDLPNKMLEIGKNIVEGVWRGIQNAKDAFMSNVQGFFSGIVDGVKSTLGIHSPSSVFADSVGAQIPAGVEKGVLENMSTIISSIQSQMDLLAAGLDISKSIQIDTQMMKISNNFINVIKTMVQTSTQSFNMLQNIVKSTCTQMSNMFTQATNSMTSAASNMTNAVTSQFNAMSSNCVKAVSNMCSNCVSTMNGYKSQFEQAGRNLMDGVKNGINSKAGEIANAAAQAVKNAVNAAKNAADIHSPSRVMEREVGQWLPAGIAVGFESAMGNATKNMQNALDSGMDSLETKDVDINDTINVEAFASKIKRIYEQVAVWFESIEQRIGNSVDNMIKKLDYLINAGKTIMDTSDSMGYIAYNEFGNRSGSNRSSGDAGQNSSDGDGGNRTYIFNSPKAIDEIEAAKQIKRIERELAEGF